MRHLLFALLFLTACNKGDTDVADTDVADTDVADTDVTDTVDLCDACSDDATCVTMAGVASCVCDDGFEGDGETCTDVDECATDNGGCDVNAVCTNTDGDSSCECKPAFEGDGQTCTPWVDEARSACTFLQAEHPSYTTIDRDVALCGNRYDTSNLEAACNTGWHVCGESEWISRYPIRSYRTSPTDPDLIGPTLGPLTSWGVSQTDRCAANVWEAGRPADSLVWDEPVCHDPDAAVNSYSGGAYNPWNNVKVLFDDDGSTILSGLAQDGGTDNCCDWDVSFEVTEETGNFAVYCCLD